MLDAILETRFNKLFEIKMDERRKHFPHELAEIDSRAVARGMFGSSQRILQIQQAFERELEVRAILAWESLVRVHRIFDQPMSDTLRDDLKKELKRRIDQSKAELSSLLIERMKNSRLNMTVSLSDAHHAILAKHDVEVDLYVDSISTNIEGKDTATMTQNYHFYGTVGSVQTGANASANVVQNLGEEDRASLTKALQQVHEALANAPTVGEQQRSELMDIADECISQVSSDSPNNTKLLTMFNVLGTAIQSLASAQPAYQALKMAVLPLGITLP